MNKTHTHTQKLELRTLYFNFDWLFQNRLSQSVTEKSLIISLNHHNQTNINKSQAQNSGILYRGDD